MKTDIVRLGPFQTAEQASGALEGLKASRARDGNVSVKGEPEEGEGGVWFVTAIVEVEEEDLEDEEDARGLEPTEMPNEDPAETDINAAYFLGLDSGARGLPQGDPPPEPPAELPIDQEVQIPELYSVDAPQDDPFRPDEIAAAARESVGDLQEEFQNAENTDQPLEAVIILRNDNDAQKAELSASEEDEGEEEGEEDRRRREREEILMAAEEGPSPSPAQGA